MVMRRAGNSQVKRSDTFWSRMRAPAICQFFETSGLFEITHDGNDDDKVSHKDNDFNLVMRRPVPMFMSSSSINE